MGEITYRVPVPTLLSQPSLCDCDSESLCARWRCPWRARQLGQAATPVDPQRSDRAVVDLRDIEIPPARVRAQVEGVQICGPLQMGRAEVRRRAVRRQRVA